MNQNKIPIAKICFVRTASDTWGFLIHIKRCPHKWSILLYNVYVL